MATDPVQLGPLRQISQQAGDMARAVAYYRDVLGLPLIASFGDALAFFDLGGTRLLLEPGKPGGDDGAVGSVLYFAVADIEVAHRQLRGRGVEFIDEPHAIHRDDKGTFGPVGEEEWMVFFHDSEGNTLALSARRTPEAD